MSQDAVEKVLGRMLTDDLFRYRAQACLRTVCREEGYLLTDEELGLVKGADLQHFDRVSKTLDAGIKRFAVCTNKHSDRS